MEELKAYREIEIPIELQDGPTEIRIPFTVGLLLRVEETLQKCEGRKWIRLFRSDKSLILAFEEFCKPYLPANFDFQSVQPTFCALFFSHVRGELMRSISDCENSMTSTPQQDSSTETKTTKEDSPVA